MINLSKAKCTYTDYTLIITQYTKSAKKQTVLRVDNLVMANRRKVYDISKVLQFYLEKKCKTCMSVHINILCLICINLHYT